MFYYNHTPETHFHAVGFSVFNRTNELYFIGYNKNQNFNWRDLIPCIEFSANGLHVGMWFGITIGLQIMFNNEI